MSHPRALDHLVLPVSGLEAARTDYEQLGFSVAPDARHPFGTSNACVFLADGIYLEPLAVHSRETVQEAARAGNMFVARDQAFRFRVGEAGLSALVMKSSDARADNERFHAEGISGGPMLSFSRMVKQPDGSEKEASFHLAFAADLRSPDFFAFNCERVNAAPFPPAPNHANGVTGLKAVVLTEENPSDFQYFVETVLGQRDARAHSFGLRFEAANMAVEVLTPAGLVALYDVMNPRSGRGLLGEGLIFRVSDLRQTEKCLIDRQVSFVRQSGRLVTRPKEAGRLFFAFEE